MRLIRVAEIESHCCATVAGFQAPHRFLRAADQLKILLRDACGVFEMLLHRALGGGFRLLGKGLGHDVVGQQLLRRNHRVDKCFGVRECGQWQCHAIEQECVVPYIEKADRRDGPHLLVTRQIDMGGQGDDDGVLTFDVWHVDRLGCLAA